MSIPWQDTVGDQPGLPMGGMEAAKRAVCDNLQALLPGVCKAARGLLNVPDGTSASDLLPIPDTYLPYEPPALDAGNLVTDYTRGATAMLFVSCMALTKLDSVNIDGPDRFPTFDAYYPIQVICWVKGQAWADTIAASNNLITAVRMALLRQQGLNEPGTLRIDTNSYRELAVEPEVAQGNRHYRASGCSFTLIIRETLIIPPYGDVTNIDDTVGILVPSFSTRPNPAFDEGPFQTGTAT